MRFSNKRITDINKDDITEASPFITLFKTTVVKTVFTKLPNFVDDLPSNDYTYDVNSVAMIYLKYNRENLD